MKPPPIPEYNSCLGPITKLDDILPLAPKIIDVAAPAKNELIPSSLALTFNKYLNLHVQSYIKKEQKRTQNWQILLQFP